jgi:hypothetical protein
MEMSGKVIASLWVKFNGCEHDAGTSEVGTATLIHGFTNYHGDEIKNWSIITSNLSAKLGIDKASLYYYENIYCNRVRKRG